MTRNPIPLLVIFALLVSACAKEKKETPSSPSTVATPMDTAEKDMVPIVRPTPSEDGSKPIASSTKTSVSTSTSTNSGPEPRPTPEPTPEPKPRPNPNKDAEMKVRAQRIAQNVQLSCEGNRCHPSVGLLSVVVKDEAGWGAGQCTASLVAPDVMVTNGHCIPMDLKEPGSDCHGRIWINFGKEAGLDDQIECSQVIYRHKDPTFDGADYSYIRLEHRSNRPFLTQSRAGFENNKQYFLHKVNPIRMGGVGLGGHMEKVTCTSRYNAAVFDQPLTAQSHTNFFVDCLVVKGNSGAPILAEDGTIRGVIYSFLRPEKVQQLLGRNGSILPSAQDMSPLNLGSNFACLKGPGDIEGKNIPAACQGHAQRLRQAKIDAEARLVARLKPQAHRHIEGNQGSRVDIQAFGWTVKTSNSPSTGRVALGYPDCVRVERAASLLGQKTRTHRPYFFIKAKYDKYATPSHETLVWAGFADTTEMLSLAREGATFRTQITDPANGQTELNSALSACGK